MTDEKIIAHIYRAIAPYTKADFREEIAQAALRAVRESQESEHKPVETYRVETWSGHLVGVFFERKYATAFKDMLNAPTPPAEGE